MNPLESLRMLAGARRAEGTAIRRPSNVCMTQMEAVEDSSDGTVKVDPGGLVISQDGSQYIDAPTIGNVRAGDQVNVALVGDDGSAKSMVVLAPVGGGDRQQKEIDEAGTTATKYITDVTDDGVWVTPEGAGPEEGEAVSTTSGWHISDALELFRKGVSMFKAYVEDSVAKVRIGPWDSGHILIDSTGIDFRYAIHSIAKIVRKTAGVTLSLGSSLVGAGHSAWLDAYTDGDGWTICGVHSSHGQSGYPSTGADIEARATTGTSLVYMHGKELTVSDTYNGALNGIYNVPMGNFGKLARCRIDIAYGVVTIPANDGTQITLTFVNGGFDDANYICAITPMNLTNGFDKCGWCVVSREAGAVRLGAWNNNAYAVTVNVGVIGVDSRYGTVV